MDLLKRAICGLVGICCADAISLVTSCVPWSEPHDRPFPEGRTARRYQIPRNRPEGEVAIGFFGLEDDDWETTHLHLQMAVLNRSERSWKVDARQLTAVVPVRGYTRPRYVGSRPARPPEVAIHAGTEAVIDLLFALSGTPEDIESWSQFDFIWCVDADGPWACERTTMDTGGTEPVEAAFPRAGLYFWQNDDQEVQLP